MAMTKWKKIMVSSEFMLFTFCVCVALHAWLKDYSAMSDIGLAKSRVFMLRIFAPFAIIFSLYNIHKKHSKTKKNDENEHKKD